MTRTIPANLSRKIMGSSVFALISATGNAEPISMNFSFSCPLPLVGSQSVYMAIETDLPPAIPVNTSIGPADLSAQVVFAPDVYTGMSLVSATTVTGDVTFEFRYVRSDAAPGAATVATEFTQLDLARFDVSGGSSSPEITGLGILSATQFEDEGSYYLSLNNAELNLQAFLADGSPAPAPLDDFTADCDSGGSTTAIHHFLVTAPEPPSMENYRFVGSGRIQLERADGILPLQVTVETEVDPASQQAQSDILVNPTTGTLKPLLGFLPTQADVRFKQIGDASGQLTSTTLSLDSSFDIRLPKISADLFGLDIRIAGGEQCGVESPITVQLASGGEQTFTRESGGYLEGNFNIGKLTNCGALTPIVSTLISGSGNRIELDLTPSDR